MSKRRTRSSSRQDERKFICRFERCTVSLATELQREVHEKTHQADKPLQCEESACNERFATSTEYEEHGKIAHLRRRSKRRKTNNGGALLAYDDVHHEKQEIHGEDGEVEVPDFDTVKDANEIVENAVYLASQMRIARSYGIATWSQQDYQNAHQWASWVQNAVRDFSDTAFLSTKLKEENLHIEPLRNAERCFFDSVLGYEGLSSEILGHIVSSFSNEEDDVADEDQEKESVDCLVASIADAMERKTNLSLLHGFLSDITTMIPPNGPLPSDLVLKEFNEEPRVDVVAKAHFLLKRHNQLPDSEVAGHLHKVRKKLDEEMFEILANEARLACDLANRKESDRPSREKLRHLFSFIRGEFEKNKVFALQLLGASILADLCENDYLLFDSYLSFLLERHHKLSSGVLNRTLVRVKNGVVSLRQAAAEKVSSEGAQAPDIEEVRSRIKGLMNRKGAIGYMTKRVVESYLSRQGMLNLNSLASEG